MRILISGSHGFIGSMVYDHFVQQGHEVFRLIRPRQAAHTHDVFYDAAAGYIDHARIEGFDAVIHLAGENILGRWSKSKRQRIYDSRVVNTQFLCENLSKSAHKPKVLLCASAIGYYGNRGGQVCTETSDTGDSFLSRTCADWEAATRTASDAGVRVVNLRLGIVLDKHGGSLAKMLPAFKVGLGGPLGDGNQWVSWITLADAVGIIDFTLHHKSLFGPVNVVSPEPVRNREFTKTLGKALHRPAVVSVPKMMLIIMFGRMAEETLLAGTKVIPDKLAAAGYAFRHPELAGAFEAIL
ncbi:MAG: TIGR01777 family oxidoreductase [Planctomycetota bacterium]|jgi:uncharacterized protein (TIGR01777 family)